MEQEPQNNECCPVFRHELWDGRTHRWENKKFIKDSVPTLFHMPFPPLIGKKMTHMCDLAEKVNAMEGDKSEMLVLFHDPSAFKSEMYMQVNKEVPEANNVTISGTFVSKVFDGPYNAVPKFIKEMDAYLAESNQKAKDYYVHYAYCPGCMKKFGHNYMVLFAEV